MFAALRSRLIHFQSDKRGRHRYDICTLVCCRLQDGKAAEAELRGLAEASGGKHTEHDLIRHNLVVFRGGEGAQQVRLSLHLASCTQHDCGLDSG